jgi:hypothetical protein
MTEIGRTSKYFDCREDQRMYVEKSNIFVIQGFKTSVDLYQKGILLQIDFVSRCLQKNSALVYIQELKKRGNTDKQIEEDLSSINFLFFI